jgi:hypothetical protein
MKNLTIIAAMLLAAGVANAADGAIDLTAVTTMFVAAVAAITTFVAAAGLAKAGLGAVIWGWRKAVSLVSSR